MNRCSECGMPCHKTVCSHCNNAYYPKAKGRFDVALRPKKPRKPPDLREPTMEELEKMIAERLPTMPARRAGEE